MPVTLSDLLQPLDLGAAFSDPVHSAPMPTQPVAVDLTVSKPSDIELSMPGDPVGPITFPYANGIPADAGVYRFDCITWFDYAGEEWQEFDWQYIGEGLSVAGRMTDYEAGARAIAKNGAVNQTDHAQMRANDIVLRKRQTTR